MNKLDTQERKTIVLTDAELDAVVGGEAGNAKVTPHDIHFSQQADKASAKLM